MSRSIEIYNLACPASPIHYQHDPVQTTKTSVHGAINMLGLAKRLRAKILQASTSEVYGDPSVHPQTEDYWGNVNPIGPRSCYDEGKRCAETLFFDYWRQHKLRIKVARIFNTYGPRMHPNDGRVVSNFIVQALLGRDITVYRRWRANPLLLLCRRPDRGPDPADEYRRRCHRPDQYRQSGEFTMLRARRLGARADRFALRIVHRPLPQDDPRQRQPDISRAHEVLDWAAADRAQGGPRRTIAYFEELLRDDTIRPFIIEEQGVEA